VSPDENETDEKKLSLAASDLEVEMYDVPGVHVFDSEQQLSQVERRFAFSQIVFIQEPLKQVATRHAAAYNSQTH